jgi:hypothetical protein
MEDQDCKVLCPKQVTDADVDILRQRVAEESRVLWYVISNGYVTFFAVFLWLHGFSPNPEILNLYIQTSFQTI